MSNHPAQAGTSPNKDGISRPGGGHRPLAAPRPDRSTPSSVGTFHPAPNADGPHEGDAPLRFRVQEAWERLCRSVRPHVPVLALYGALKRRRLYRDQLWHAAEDVVWPWVAWVVN